MTVAPIPAVFLDAIKCKYSSNLPFYVRMRFMKMVIDNEGRKGDVRVLEAGIIINGSKSCVAYIPHQGMSIEQQIRIVLHALVSHSRVPTGAPLPVSTAQSVCCCRS